MKRILFCAALSLFSAFEVMQTQERVGTQTPDSISALNDYRISNNQLKGFEHSNDRWNILNVPSGFTGRSTITIQNAPDFNIVIYEYQKDSIHVLVLTKLISADSLRPRIKPLKEKIFDVTTVTFSDERLRFADTYCECDGRKDDSIIALVRETYEEYLTDVKRAWRIDKKMKRFEEISTKGIRCENMAYGD